MTRWESFILLNGFVFIFFLSLISPNSVSAVACSGACGGSITCDGGLNCNGGVCYNPVNVCTGSTCVTEGGYNGGACNNTNQCTPGGTVRTSTWIFGACSASCGTNTRLGTCTAGAQNNCTAPACTSPAGAVGSTYNETTCACVGQAPQAPVLSPVGPTSCTTTGQVSVNWTFGTGGCGGAWGYACSTPSNTFSIKDGAATIVSGIPAGTSPYTRNITLPAGLHQISVCAGNGVTTTCSGQSPVDVSIDTTAPPIPGGRTVTLIPDGTCPDKYIAKYSWNAVSDVGCGGLNALPYWDQISTSNTFATVVSSVLNNTWSNPNPISDQTTTPYPPNTTLYFHVKSRDSFDQQSSWSATDTVVVPSPSPYPTINVSGSFAEDVGVPSGTTCVSNISLNPLGLTLQPTISPSNGVTSDCSLITATTYSCNITIDNQQGLCVSPNITISMGGTYSGYSTLGWRAGGICSGAPVSYNMGIGTAQVAPLFFQYAGGSGGGGGGGGAGGSGGWFKLKDASFNSRLSGRQNFIPSTILTFDSTGDDSTANKNMMIGTAGLLVQENPVEIGTSGTTYSQNNWYTNSYTHSNDVTYLKYIDYIKSRKDYQAITSIDEVVADGIYSIDTSVSLSPAQFDGKKVVLVVTGGSSATFSTDFISTGSVAVLAKDITIDPTVGQINAILIGENVTAGSSSAGLKIKGNLIDQSTFLIDREQSDARKPSLFVIFDVQLYLDLLPYLSTSTYDWRQIQ